MALPVSFLSGLALSLVIGVLAYRRGSLTRGGVLGAVLTGTAIFGFGGFVPGLLLVAFFVSSTLLSHYQARAKAQFNEKFQKGSRRDLGQALANGGWAALIAIVMGLAQLQQWDARTQMFLFLAFIGAMAAVTADTWATEIGVLSSTLPRMITTGRLVPAGTSGAVTLLGTVTAFCGGAFIGGMLLVGNLLLGLAADFERVTSQWVGVIVGGFAMGFYFILLAGVSGLMGSLFDSLLGATVQAIYFCEYDETQTEKKIHGCGRATRLVRGWRWCDNDVVNFAASVFGSVIAVLLAILIV